MSQSDQFIKNFLGESFFEDLKKSNELFKLGTQTALDPEEIRIGLKIVPRAVMSFLIAELVPMAVGDQKVVKLPFGVEAVLNVNKGDTDSYSGSVVSDNKPVYDYRNRSIPGIGIILLSTFELYNLGELEKETKYEPAAEVAVQKLIDERMALHSLVTQVVEEKITQREAIQKLMMAKLTEALEAEKKIVHPVAPVHIHALTPIDVQPKDIVKKETSPRKGSPLKEFIARKKPKEFAIKMNKCETVDCPDCGKTIFGEGFFAGCVCLGENMNSQIWIKKAEDGVKIRFSRQWDVENIEMLLQILRRKDG